MQADPRQHKPDRRCAWAGCTTTLSIYNSDYLCWVHADERTRARYERVVTGRIGAVPQPRGAEPTEASTHRLLSSSSLQGIRIVDPRALASIRAGNDTGR